METDDLNRLIRTLNEQAHEGEPGEMELLRADDPGAAALPSPSPEVSEGLRSLLAETVRRDGSDLLLVPLAPPTIRRNGRLEAVPGARPLGSSDALELVGPSLDAARRRRFAEAGVVDLSLPAGPLGRFRVNLHRTRGGTAAALRALPRAVPAFADLGLPEALAERVRAARGLVLVTGPTGSGKSTTLASLVDRINRTERRHVVTIEDPVEYEHPHALSIVEQVEVGADAPGFAEALVAALRQDPDVLLVGEMRDAETARTVLTAAETGHVVLTTLHTNDAAQTVNRVLDLFPGPQQGQVRQQLSLALSAIVCQQLVPRRDGRGRALAVELLIATDSVRAHVRRGSFHQLHGELTLGRRFGMVTMEESLARLVQAGVVDEAEARLRASHPDDLSSFLR